MTLSVTLIIVIITCMVSIPAFTNRNLFDQFKHHPYTEKREKQYYRWITSGFLHGSWVHLGINMYVFYEFGRHVEHWYKGMFGLTMGAILFLVMYLLTIVLADTPTYFKYQDNPNYSAIGASGGVSGILFAFILFMPWSMLGLFFVVPIPAIVFGVLYLWYESWSAKNSRDNIGHDAHFWGAVAGVVITIIYRPTIFIDFISKLTNDFPFG
jgi:membrane associated rhomboid family serine protease